MIAEKYNIESYKGHKTWLDYDHFDHVIMIRISLAIIWESSQQQNGDWKKVSPALERKSAVSKANLKKHARGMEARTYLNDCV